MCRNDEQKVETVLSALTLLTALDIAAHCEDRFGVVNGLAAARAARPSIGKLREGRIL